MTATITARNTPLRASGRRGYPMAVVAALAGTIAVLNSSGYCQPGTTATGLHVVGRFAASLDNSAGSAGDLIAEVESGVFRYENSASTDEITIADIGQAAYLVDNQTVAKTSASGTRSPAGIIDAVDSAGVWVRMGEHALVAPAGALARVQIQNDLTVHTGDGACATSGINLVTGGTGISGLTLAAPTPGDRCEIRVDSLSSGDVVVTSAAGVTLDGTNNTATLNAAAEALILVYGAANTWAVVENVGSVALTSV